MKNKFVIILLCMTFFVTFDFVIVDNVKASNGLHPFDYWHAPPNSFGFMSATDVNDTYFQNWFNTNTKYRLEALNPNNETWMNATSLLIQTYYYDISNNSFKITWNFTSAKNWRYRLKYGINADVIDYVNKSSYVVLLNFSIGNNESSNLTYPVYFNFSDLKHKIENGSLIEKHGFKQVGDETWFWFKLTTLNPIAKGRNFIMDPTFGYRFGVGNSNIDLNDRVIAGTGRCLNNGFINNITCYVVGVDASDRGKFVIYDEGLNLIYESWELAVDNGTLSAGWYTHEITKVVPCVAGTKYIIGAISDVAPDQFQIKIQTPLAETWWYGGYKREVMDYSNPLEDPIGAWDLNSTASTTLAYCSYTLRPGTVRFKTSRDTHIVEASPDTNYDNTGQLDVVSRDANRDRRTLIRFDEDNLSNIPSNAIITNALVYLYYFEKSGNDPVGRTLNIHRITGFNWIANESTWNSRKAGLGWVAQGGDYDVTVEDSLTVPAGFGWVSWNVTVDIRDVINNGTAHTGYLIKDNTEGSATNYRTSYYDSTHAKRNGSLNITYRLPEPLPIIVSVWPGNNSIDLCPCCLPVNVTVVQTNGTLMDILYELNDTGVWVQYSTIFDDVPNGSYAMLVCDFNKFNYNYWIRITVSTPAGSNVTILKYTTINDINCSGAANVTGASESWVSDNFLESNFDFSPEFMLFFLWLFIFYLWWKSETEDMTLLLAILFVPYSVVFTATTLLLYNTSWIIQIVFISFSLIVLAYTIDERRKRRK